jgi:hypothetical protein
MNYEDLKEYNATHGTGHGIIGLLVLTINDCWLIGISIRENITQSFYCIENNKKLLLY